ncbi:MAG: hypothetical protein JWP79_1888, partial [Polaromonas sp.]|nr:hypothetical protein [Polaromonas sp.]
MRSTALELLDHALAVSLLVLIGTRIVVVQAEPDRAIEQYCDLASR